MNKWPLQSECNRFYGNPNKNGSPDPKWESANLVAIVPPYRMTYAGKPIKTIRVHKKCAESLLRILNRIFELAGHSQATVDAWGASIFGGAYNFRLMRGGVSLSMHSWGCAIDLDPANNGLGDQTPKFDKHPLVMQAFEEEGWEWGGSWSKRDGMHWQAAWTRAGGVRWKAPKVISPARLLSLPEPPKADDVDDGPTDLEVIEPTVVVQQGSPDLRSLSHPLLRVPAYPADARWKEPKNDPVVYYVQAMLDYWGWSEVGTVDGLLGSRTEGAILAYRNEHIPKLEPLTTDIDQELLDQLSRGPRRTVSITRASTTAADLKAEGEQTIISADNVKTAGGVLAGFGLIGGADQQGAIDRAKTAVDGAGTAQEIAEKALGLVQWLAQKWWVPVIIIGAFIIWKAFKVVDQRLSDHRTGKNTAL